MAADSAGSISGERLLKEVGVKGYGRIRILSTCTPCTRSTAMVKEKSRLCQSPHDLGMYKGSP